MRYTGTCILLNKHLSLRRVGCERGRHREQHHHDRREPLRRAGEGAAQRPQRSGGGRLLRHESQPVIQAC